MKTKQSLRDEIDEIDQSLVKLFERRMKISREIARRKKETNTPIFDKAREDKVIKTCVHGLSDHTLDTYVKLFFKNIMDLSKEIQKNVMRS